MEDFNQRQDQPPFGTGGTNLDPKIIAAISYITIVGWIVAYVMNNPRSTFISFHIRQSLGIIALATAAGIIGIVPILGWIAAFAGWLGAALLWILGILGALKGEEHPVPFLGEQFQEWFKGI